MKHYISIGLTIAAGALSLAALPLVSASVSDANNTSVWAQQALQFQGQKTAAPQPTGLAARLSDVHSGSVDLTLWQRDAAQTADIKQIDYARIERADHADKQAQCLSEAIYYEARSETLAGQKAVAEVVLNRVVSKHFPDTICGVVYEGANRKTGCQFSFTCDGSLSAAPSGKSWDRAQTVATHMMIDAHSPMTRKATHYHTVDINPQWASYVKPTRTIGSHKFYKFKSRRELAMTQSVAP